MEDFKERNLLLEQFRRAILPPLPLAFAQNLEGSKSYGSPQMARPTQKLILRDSQLRKVSCYSRLFDCKWTTVTVPPLRFS